MKLDAQQIQDLARLTVATRPDEISCEEWLARVGRYVELKQAGASIPEELQCVVQHLDVCPDCAEELDALERALTG